MSIGQVLTKLRPLFPDLTPSKVRFLEEQGLICPQRTESGYRKFSASDVERVRFILSLQRDRYLPLKVIKAYIDDVDAGRTPTLAGLVAPAESVRAGGVPSFYSRDELIAQTGASAALVGDAVNFGLLPPGPRFSEAEMRIVDALAALARFGLEPRHLRTYRVQVEREAGLVESVVGPLSARGSADAQARAARVSQEMIEALAALHGTMLQAALSHLDP